jgi:metacaspase-1
MRFLEPGVFLGRAAARRAQAVEAAPVRGVIRPFGGVLLSGCADPEFSFDAWFGGRANGAFSYVALRALAQLKPGGRYRDWHGLIRASCRRGSTPRARRSAAAARRRPGRCRANPALGKS